MKPTNGDFFIDSNVFLYLFDKDQKKVDIAFFIFQKYQYRYFDCVIIASALENDCPILYSEDMQHKQVIENPEKKGAGKLTIVNPFI